MNSVFFDAPMNDDARRLGIHDGQLFVFLPRPSSLALCELARDMAKQAFHPYDPRHAQHHMPPEKYAAILAGLKPAFIHHPACKELIPRLLDELGCDLEKTYFDVPRMRTATDGGYMTAGLAYAFHPHRDTWYSAPMCQVNWWIPMYPIQPENAMAFHLAHWAKAVKNGSSEYDYARWNEAGRKAAADQIRTDTRKQPRPEEPVALDPQVRLVCPAGGIIMFSAAHLHSTVPNTSGYTRFSIDFRTVHLDDVTANQGALNVDSECTGTTMGDYLRSTDLAHLPSEIIRRYETERMPLAEVAGR
jgi:hypothetical protein